MKVIVVGGMSDPCHMRGYMHYRRLLTVEGEIASLQFLRAYFSCCADSLPHLGVPSVPVTLAGPYLNKIISQEGYDVVLIENYLPHDQVQLEQELLTGRDNVVVISTSFYFSCVQVNEIMLQVRKTCPSAFIIMGGIFVWKSYKIKLAVDAGEYSDEVVRLLISMCSEGEGRVYSPFFNPQAHCLADALIINPGGTRALLTLLQSLKNHTDWHSMGSVAYPSDRGLVINQILDEPIASPFVEWAEYQNRPPVCLPVYAGHGCNLNCAFCEFRNVIPTSKVDSIEEILEKVSHIPVVNGRRYVAFTNDNLFQNKQQAVQLCKALVESNMNISWTAYQRVWIVDEELAEWMRLSGCIEIWAGVESGNRDILRAMGKPPHPEQTLHSLRLLSMKGINTLSFFICGFPGETRETVRETVDMINNYYTEGPGVCFFKIFTFGLVPLSLAFSMDFRHKHNLTGCLHAWETPTMNFLEAVELTEWMYTQVKDTVIPHNDDMSELSVAPGSLRHFREACLTRHQLAKIKNKQSTPTHEEEQQLWEKLKFHCLNLS
ncbi:radical SAM protein [Pelomyxa schiedti]|nr:radical SAM protein [Pelomyxa schiedti]